MSPDALARIQAHAAKTQTQDDQAIIQRVEAAIRARFGGGDKPAASPAEGGDEAPLAPGEIEAQTKDAKDEIAKVKREKPEEAAREETPDLDSKKDNVQVSVDEPKLGGGGEAGDKGKAGALAKVKGAAVAKKATAVVPPAPQAPAPEAIDGASRAMALA